MIVIRRFTDIKIAKKLVGSMYGYTIIEVIIFLTISTALFLSVSMMMSGRNDRTRFSQAVVDLDENLQDVFNDVSSGYYPSSNDFKCVPNTTAVAGHTVPELQAGTAEKGSNSNCVFAGKLISLPKKNYNSTVTERDKYFIHTMISYKDADFDKFTCTLLLGGVGDRSNLNKTNPGVREERNIGYGLQVTKLVLKDKTTNGNSLGRDFTGDIITGVSVVQDFAGEVGQNKSKTGNSSRVKVYAYKDVPTTSGYPRNDYFLPLEGSNKITICLAQDGNGRKAAIVISANMSTERFIDNVPAECS